MANQVQKVRIVADVPPSKAIKGKPKNPLAGNVVEGGVVVLTGTDNEFDQAVNRQGTGDGSFVATQKLFLVRTPVTVGESDGTAADAKIRDLSTIELVREARVINDSGTDWTPGRYLGFDADGNIIDTADANDLIIGLAVDKRQGLIDIQPGRWAAPFLVV